MRLAVPKLAGVLKTCVQLQCTLPIHLPVAKAPHVTVQIVVNYAPDAVGSTLIHLALVNRVQMVLLRLDSLQIIQVLKAGSVL